jgi:hexokinase
MAFNTEGSSRDVSEDTAGEIVDQAIEPDDNLTEATKRFIDRLHHARRETAGSAICAAVRGSIATGRSQRH